MGGPQVTVSWTFRWPPILTPVGLVVLLGFETLSPWDGARIVLLTFTDDFEIIALITIDNYTILFWNYLIPI